MNILVASGASLPGKLRVEGRYYAIVQKDQQITFVDLVSKRSAEWSSYFVELNLRGRAESLSASYQDALARVRGGEDVPMSGPALQDVVFSGADFATAVFRDADFSGLDLRDADLSGATFERCAFNKTILSDSMLAGCTFSECEFIGADVGGADFTRAAFRNCRLERVGYVAKSEKGRCEDYSSATFSDCILKTVSFEWADLSNVRFSDCFMHLTCFNGANASNAHFERINLTMPEGETHPQQRGIWNNLMGHESFLCIFTNININNAHFEYCDFEGCSIMSYHGTNMKMIACSFKHGMLAPSLKHEETGIDDDTWKAFGFEGEKIPRRGLEKKREDLKQPIIVPSVPSDQPRSWKNTMESQFVKTKKEMCRVS
ncbi:pentapeptide repeat-containing protein [Paraburkholderia sediminicola]|uniref:pentapeptide repeat-containing protein n=1 Tax=Paraburkholderia sediminicola TaxID=458836 RepID=UPI0038BD9516